MPTSMAAASSCSSHIRTSRGQRDLACDRDEWGPPGGHLHAHSRPGIHRFQTDSDYNKLVYPDRYGSAVMNQGQLKTLQHPAMGRV